MSDIFKALTGGKTRAEKQLEQFSPVGFGSSGLSGSFDSGSNTFSLTRSEGLNTAISDLVAGFRQRAEGFRGLRGQVAPGVGRFTRARVESLRNQRRRTVGNLRESLARRRVQGSSFAEDLVTSAEAEFAQREAELEGEGVLTEIGLTAEFIAQETQAAVDAAGALIEQFNLESSLAAGLSTFTTAQLNANLQAQAGVAASASAGAGEFLGTVIGAVVGGPIGAGIAKKIS